MLFFQTTLVCGYFYAHATMRWLQPRAQSLLHCGLLAAGLLVLPLQVSARWKPVGAADPVFLILGLLAGSVGLPYFLLSSTGPLLQAWYAKQFAGRSPYRLFALSNLGSLLALITYPTCIEPFFPLPTQTMLWSTGFGVFALATACIAWYVRTLPPTVVPETCAYSRSLESTLPRSGDYVLWTALAACASVLLLAFTTHITQNIAPIPLLWVAPLTLYLLSFILCFDSTRWYWRPGVLTLLALGISASMFLLAETEADAEHEPGMQLQLAVFLTTLFAACMFCHGELARRKPAMRYLTTYYLVIAVGGAVGGIFVGLVAPRLFNDMLELPLGLSALALLVAIVLAQAARQSRQQASRVAAVAAGVAVCVLSAITLSHYVAKGRDARLQLRNFYAALRVTDEETEDEESSPVRALYHGTILHGSQFLDPARRLAPTTYYGPDSGVGIALRALASRTAMRIGVVGLGVGTLASYGRQGERWRFYEINPQVISIATSAFTFLHESAAQYEVILGDARLSLERETPQHYDLLVLDAFAGDTIPVHLLTQEALSVYLRHLREDGLLAVHISNKYVDLLPVMKRLAEAAHLVIRWVEDNTEDKPGLADSDWVVLAKTPALLSHSLFAAARPLDGLQTSVPLWTDNYSNLYSILK